MVQNNPNQYLVDVQDIQKVVKKTFAQYPTDVEQVAEGVSTFVYRILFPHETFYLRILPEEGASFAPEAAVHTRLRSMQLNVQESLILAKFAEPAPGMILDISICAMVNCFPFTFSPRLCRGIKKRCRFHQTMSNTFALLDSSSMCERWRVAFKSALRIVTHTIS